MRKPLPPDELRPSEYTIRLIKVIAHSYGIMGTKDMNMICRAN